jgi:hypothetical protein
MASRHSNVTDDTPANPDEKALLYQSANVDPSLETPAAKRAKIATMTCTMSDPVFHHRRRRSAVKAEVARIIHTDESEEMLPWIDVLLWV